MPLGADRLSGVFITPILLILTHTKRVFANMYEARKLDKIILRSEIRISGKRSASVDVEDIIFTIASSSHHSPPPHSGFTRLSRIRVALGSWAVRLSGCDHIKIHFGKPSRHAFGSLRANSYSHLVRFDSLLTAPSRCLRACTLQAQAVPPARPEDVLAPRESPARVIGVRGGTFRLRFMAVRSCIGSSVVGSVCVFLSARLRRRVAPLCSYRCLFVGLVVARAWCVINRQRRESIALLFLLVLSLTAWLSPRHPVQRRPAIVLVPFGTSPDHGALIFLFVKQRAADCARCPLRIRI